MTEFHHKEDQGHSVDPPVDTAQDLLNGASKNKIRKAILPDRESASEPMAEMKAEVASSSPEPAPYERLQQGPITYFRYYFEDAGQPTYLTSPTVDLPTQKRNLMPLYLAGGGVLGATLISGFVIAGLANNSKAPSQKGTTDSKVKKTPAPKLIQPQVASPEVVPPSRSSSTKPSQTTQKTPTKKPAVPTVRSSADSQLQQALMVPQPLPVPQLPIVSVPIAQTVSTPLPAPIIQPLARQITPPAPAPATPTPPAPLAAKPLPVLVANSSPMPPSSASPALAQPGASSTPAIADARCLSAATTAKDSLATPGQPPIAVQSALLVAAPENVVMPSATRMSQTEKPAAIKGAIADSAAQASSVQDAEKDLQAFLEIPQRFPSSAGLAVMPLPCQLAQTATTKQQVAEFKVVRLSPQDYQKRWKLSSNNPQALTPIYGFVDYKQQSVVLLSAKEEKVSKL